MVILLVFDSRQTHIIVLVICNCMICTNSIIHFVYIVFLYIRGKQSISIALLLSPFPCMVVILCMQTACILKLMEINCIELN